MRKRLASPSSVAVGVAVVLGGWALVCVCSLGEPAFSAVIGDSHFHYGQQTAARRDPFRPPNLLPAGTEKRGPLGPLERYDIGQLKLVGVVWQLGQPRAMVEDEAGLGFIVEVGTRIGKNGGVVTKVEPNRVMIEEAVLNFYGAREVRRVEMKLVEEEAQ